MNDTQLQLSKLGIRSCWDLRVYSPGLLSVDLGLVPVVVVVAGVTL